MIALIDGDVVAQRASFAAEKTHYKVYIFGEEELGGVIASLSSKSKLDEWMKDKDPEQFLVEREKVYADEDTAIMAAKVIMESILEQLKVSTYKLYIKGTGNFRYDVATIKPYKGNRDPSARPIYIDAVYSYLSRVWGAEKVDGIEVDDKLGIEQLRSLIDNDSTIICTNDKDLNMIPGWHFDFTKEQPTKVWIDEVDAMRNFYLQLLTGDPTDNIPGLYQITGKKVVASIKAGLEKITNTRAMYEYVHNAYEHAVLHDPLITQENLDSILLEIGRLLWIQRYEDDVWEFPS